MSGLRGEKTCPSRPPSAEAFLCFSGGCLHRVHQLQDLFPVLQSRSGADPRGTDRPAGVREAKYKEEKIVLSFSGGKDSTVTADLVQKALSNPSLVHIFGNTTFGNGFFIHPEDQPGNSILVFPDMADCHTRIGTGSPESGAEGGNSPLRTPSGSWLEPSWSSLCRGLYPFLYIFHQ